MGSTCCFSSARLPSSFSPTSGNERPAADISTSLRIGPTDCDAALALTSAIETGSTLPLACVTQMCALGSCGPTGDWPLNTLLARPSQKLRKLNAALIVVGAFRPVAWRTC